MTTRRSMSPAMEDTTRNRLLQAAERILVEQGVHALTVRHVGKVADLNATLVTYHFGGVAQLLAELCECNLAVMLRGWQALDRQVAASEVDPVLKAWLAPLCAPAAFHPQGRAVIVLDEIAAHGSPEISARLMDEMVGIARRVQELLGPLLPHLSATELRARLRFIAGAALGPPPRVPSPEPAGPALDSLPYLLRFAAAALDDRVKPAVRAAAGSRPSAEASAG